MKTPHDHDRGWDYEDSGRPVRGRPEWGTPGADPRGMGPMGPGPRPGDPCTDPRVADMRDAMAMGMDPRESGGPGAEDWGPGRGPRDRQPRGRARRGDPRARGRGFGPDGFGPGPWAGPGHPFPGGPGFGPYGMRRARRGDVRAAVLSLLAEEELNGYQVMKRIARNTGGMWRPSTGSIYPSLQQLVADGLIEAAGEDGPRTDYRLTEAGRQYVAAHAEELAQAWENTTGTSEEATDLQEAVAKLMGAIGQLTAAGSDEQAKAATGVIDDARRALYKLLAD